jgi:ABC-type sulfate/molybdate transport systems ATPase subunit
LALASDIDQIATKTLIRLLTAGLEFQDRGQVFFNDVNAEDLRQWLHDRKGATA